MKIVCGACGAKYSIADEKVQGKVFKIRCRKCSNVIVVKGTNDGADSGSGAMDASHSSPVASGYGAPAGATPEWYVVIDGEQAGPLTVDDIGAHVSSGRVQSDSYVWKDGMSDWVALSTVEAFSHLVGTGGFGPDDEQDSTMIAESPLGAGPGYGNEVAAEEPTSMIDANSWQNQAGFADDDDPTAAVNMAELGFGSLGASSAPSADLGGGYGATPSADLGGYGASADLGGGYGASADLGGGYGSAPSADLGGGYGAAPSADLGAGFGSEPADAGLGMGLGAGAGIESAGDLGGGGMFGSFDAQDNNTGGGLEYQSFAGIDSGSAGADLGASGGLDAGGYGAAAGGYGGYGADAGGAAATDNNFSDANDMVGTRNENSVLFSLSSLQQVQAVQQKDDVPLTDGSGLIDIQALASTHSAMSGAGGGVSDPFGGPSSSPAADTFAPATMSVPAIMPRGSHRDNKGLFIAVGVLALVLVGGGIAAAIVISSGNKEPTEPKVIVQEKVIIQEKLVQADNSGNKAADAAAAAKAASEKADEDQAAADAEPSEETSDDKGDSKKRKRTKRGGSKTKTGSSAAPVASSKPIDKPTRKGNESDIDGLLDSIDNGGKKPTKKAPAPKAAAKEDTTSGGDSGAAKKKLSKSDVQGTIRKYNGRIGACAKTRNSGGLSGTVNVKFTVSSSGKVTGAALHPSSSKFKGTDVGNCVVGVVRAMKFPASQANTPISKYPFILR